MNEYYNEEYFSSRNTTIDPYLKEVFINYVLSKKGINLDVGCGTGEYIKFFKNIGYNIIGIDFSSYAAKVSNQINASALAIPFKDNTFDSIYSIHVVEHLTHNELIKFLKEAKRVLKKNGRIFIVAPNKYAIGKLLSKNLFEDPSHINIPSISYLKNCLKSVGFKKIKYTFNIKPKSNWICNYYGLGKIFKKFPILQNIMYKLLFATPIAYFKNALNILGVKK